MRRLEFTSPPPRRFWARLSRADLALHTLSYLASGGRIERIEMGVTAIPPLEGVSKYLEEDLPQADEREINEITGGEECLSHC